MKPYPTKSKTLPGTEFKEVHKKALAIFRVIQRKTKRRAYLRSTYFNKDKIFLDLFWQHLWDMEKWQDRMRRLKFYEAAIEMLRHSAHTPETKENPNKPGELLHRFTGMTNDKKLFCVQVKEDKRTSSKYMISMFPKK